ncbi:MAG TPA: HupE/UreJ family protein [Beijerinckiaceae bacterium]|nr:HupE/UreJ family protein [Beijerinckiaceae bacterium]
MLSRAAAALLAICALVAGAAAHEPPADVRIAMFVKPAGNRLELVLRVPMAAMQEVDVPTRGPGYLDMSRAEAALRDAVKLWLIDNLEVYENDRSLPAPQIGHARVSLPSDRSFASYDQARRHLDGPRLADDLDLYWSQQLLDVLLAYPIQSERSDFSIRPRVERLGIRVVTALTFLPPQGSPRLFELHGDPGLVRLDPRWYHAALRFVKSGIEHIVEGLDHVLFLLCLVIPFRQLHALVILATSFTVAHSIALVAAVFGFVPDALWFPPLIETLIAATIVYTALENMIGSTVRRRWVTAFAFGIVHGFGLSFALRESFQFAGDHLITALLAFNVGVEIGQVLLLIVLVPLLQALFRYVLPERIGVIILSTLVAHTGWHWMTERGEQLLKFPLPTLDAAFIAGAMRALMAGLILALLVLLASGWLKRRMPAERRAPAE